MEWRRLVHSESGISFLHYAFGVKSLHHIRTKSLDRTSWRVGSREKKNAGGMNQNCHQEVGCYCYWWIWDEVKKKKKDGQPGSPSPVPVWSLVSVFPHTVVADVHHVAEVLLQQTENSWSDWDRASEDHSPNRQPCGSLELTAVTVDHWQQRSVREVEHLHRKMIERWSLIV